MASVLKNNENFMELENLISETFSDIHKMKKTLAQILKTFGNATNIDLDAQDIETLKKLQKWPEKLMLILNSIFKFYKIMN